ncbi:hypothetical protein HDU97_003810 [Phlyctochytrium planicorne]|nr:hypothetical protein HDU97_003810 [Phlyctochytrium planicorne]
MLLKLLATRLSEPPCFLDPALSASIIGVLAFEIRVAIVWLQLGNVEAAPNDVGHGTIIWRFTVLYPTLVKEKDFKLDSTFIKSYIKAAALIAIPIVGLNFTLGVIPQVSIAYPDSFLAATIISLSSYVLKYMLFSLLVQFEGSDANEKLKNAAEGSNTTLLIALTCPLRIFRFMKATRLSPGSYYIFLLLSQILDMGIPRVFALYMILREEEKKKKKINPEPQSPDYMFDVDAAVAMISEEKVEQPDRYLSVTGQAEHYRSLSTSQLSEQKRTIENAASVTIITQSTNDLDDLPLANFQSGNQGFASSNQLLDTLRNPHMQKSRSTSVLKSVTIKRIETKIEKLLDSNTDYTLRSAPFEYLRRDLCFADQLSNLLSLSLFLLFPRDFLPWEATDNTDQTWLQDIITLYHGPWFKSLWLAWFISFIVSIPGEYLMIWWEQNKGIHSPTRLNDMLTKSS